MIKKVLFTVRCSDGSVSVGPVKPEDGAEYTTDSCRLIADEGKMLFDGDNLYSCIDTNEPDKYTEVDAPLEEPIEETIEEENIEE